MNTIYLPSGQQYRALTVKARTGSAPITTGTVNYYLLALDGLEAGKWFKLSDGSWQVAETANPMTHKADGHWTINLNAGSPFPAASRLVEYVKESGDLHEPSGNLITTHRQTVTADAYTDSELTNSAFGTETFTAALFAPDFFTALANYVVATGLPLVSDTQQHAARAIVKGNSYGSTSRSFLITITDGADWPTDLSLWAWTFTADKHADNTNTGDASTTGTVAVVQATGDSRSVRVTLTSTATSTMAVGQYTHSLRGTQTGGLAWTIELGTLEVLSDPAA